MIHLPYTKILTLGDYEIFIRLPNDYSATTKSYPIIFVLDPNFLFSALYGVNRVVQNNIVIGIGHKGLDFSQANPKDLNYRSNLYRARDFLPFNLDPEIFMPNTDPELKKDMLEMSGKANDFALLIISRIVPLVEKNFRVTADRTLVGHSFGGVFSLFMLLEYHQFFQNYIAISPVLDSRYYIQKEMFTSISNARNIYCAFGSLEEDERQPDALQIAVRNCRKILPSAKIEIIDGEDHVSVAISGMLRHLKSINNH